MNALTGGPLTPAQTTQQMSPEEWRGKCLNTFARGELVVMRAMETARQVGLAEKIPHLASQRLAALTSVMGHADLPARLLSRLEKSISDWKDLEARRLFLAHGIMQLASEPSGKWVALLDIRVYRANQPAEDRWAVLQAEAREFLSELERAFKDLSQLVGQFRKQIEGRKSA